ncbi:hypothetical protein AGDE_03128 [Angomonas deanei]|uniref:Uncharacterized protein n=1 Tax=Angomonas deanei TaxID=59799 RepID=A0A7G2CE45_9TRYP|nr:hypothetical protein AGDE_03128 [Angomonas deanei]CAD2218128.1 hypothetical protein, conserved [Angomonas deanei]|eukprot:EPY40799.1 hypothetical protein AGDE_03128 [Angomonas deanei]
MMDTSSSKTSRENLTDEELDKVGFTRNNVACVAFIMSLWPTLPVSKRPKMTVPVQRAIDALFQGTQVCVFNESPHSPVQCLAALRLLRNYDADEGSIAIFNSSKPDVIDGYIPLAFLHSVSRGLEEVEKSKYETPSGTVSSTLLPQGTKVNVECKRALSLHCRAPQKFYVTFIVLNDHEYHNWRRVLDYFVLLNTAAANHSVKRQK